MDQKICRLLAVQCVEWASEIEDPTQHQAFTSTARQWLNVAQQIEREPDNARRAVQARLH